MERGKEGMTDKEIFDLVSDWATNLDYDLGAVSPDERQAKIHNYILCAVENFAQRTVPDLLRAMHPHDARRVCLDFLRSPDGYICICPAHPGGWIEHDNDCQER